MEIAMRQRGEAEVTGRIFRRCPCGHPATAHVVGVGCRDNCGCTEYRGEVQHLGRAQTAGYQNLYIVKDALCRVLWNIERTLRGWREARERRLSCR